MSISTGRAGVARQRVAAQFSDNPSVAMHAPSDSMSQNRACHFSLRLKNKVIENTQSSFNWKIL
jgi:hypothetical protein